MDSISSSVSKASTRTTLPGPSGLGAVRRIRSRLRAFAMCVAFWA